NSALLRVLPPPDRIGQSELQAEACASQVIERTDNVLNHLVRRVVDAHTASNGRVVGVEEVLVVVNGGVLLPLEDGVHERPRQQAGDVVNQPGEIGVVLLVYQAIEQIAEELARRRKQLHRLLSCEAGELVPRKPAGRQ